jgi:outer membrane lipoprotein-sorting protein
MLAASATSSAPSLKEVLSRMDRAASDFRGMTANISKTQHTAVLNDNSTETGSVVMKKTPKGVEAIMNITSPDKKAYAYEGRHVQIYYPNMREVDIYDVGASGQELAAQFFTLGFGTSGKDLEKNYALQVAGTEAVNGENTTHLILTPKAGEAKKLIKEVDLWLGDGNYPVQEKVLQPSGDYLLFVYSNVRINPNIKDEDVKLKLPAGVKKVNPQK